MDLAPFSIILRRIKLAHSNGRAIKLSGPYHDVSVPRLLSLLYAYGERWLACLPSYTSRDGKPFRPAASRGAWCERHCSNIVWCLQVGVVGHIGLRAGSATSCAYCLVACSCMHVPMHSRHCRLLLCCLREPDTPWAMACPLCRVSIDENRRCRHCWYRVKNIALSLFSINWQPVKKWS
jgi:hypothetical protein